METEFVFFATIKWKHHFVDLYSTLIFILVLLESSYKTAELLVIMFVFINKWAKYDIEFISVLKKNFA